MSNTKEMTMIADALNRIADSIYALGLGQGESTGAILHLTNTLDHNSNRYNTFFRDGLDDISESISGINCKG